MAALGLLNEFYYFISGKSVGRPLDYQVTTFSTKQGLHVPFVARCGIYLLGKPHAVLGVTHFNIIQIGHDLLISCVPSQEKNNH